ncbi:MAG: hypothetical protein SFV18_17130 [Bryobacteraceae bacterium]|nr:hypothetical protein [Bryobacteraceae bacterium]
MRAAILLACAALAGCVNHPNTWMPEGERKPFDGPDPKDVPVAVEWNKTAEKHQIRLHSPSATKIVVDCAGDVRVYVNARRVHDGACPVSAAIPAGTFVPDTAALIEIESDSPVLVKRAALR